jgi:hypothetical protein
MDSSVLAFPRPPGHSDHPSQHLLLFLASVCDILGRMALLERNGKGRHWGNSNLRESALRLDDERRASISSGEPFSPLCQWWFLISNFSYTTCLLSSSIILLFSFLQTRIYLNRACSSLSTMRSSSKSFKRQGGEFIVRLYAKGLRITSHFKSPSHAVPNRMIESLFT